MINIEIDGLKIEAQDGAMLIEAADEVGISIPRFCYHKKLSVAANCRMCLVDVEKAAKPLPACATPVTEGMKVFTQSQKAISAQKGVMEFLLINHPLDCPICDQGGECDLQDLAVGYGGGETRYSENKRVVKNKNIGSLIATDMTRCIHCTRCVRFGEEIAGVRELGAIGRGEHMEIGTYVASTISSELSGNMIDLCPVGALTSKPFRYSARNWEMQRHPSIAGHDCVGSNIDLDVRDNNIMRVVPRENEEINETWISDRDRFSYEGLNSKDRLTAPMIKQSGEWQRVSWDTALAFALNGVKELVGRHGAEHLGTLVSPSATLEEMYLLQKLVRGLGSSNIDHRVRQLDFSDQNRAPAFPYLGQSIESLGQSDAVLLVGANITKDQPILGHRVRQAALFGAKVMCVNSVDYKVNMPLAEKLITDVAGMEAALAGILKALLNMNKIAAPSGIDQLLHSVSISATHEKMAANLSKASHGSVLLGLSAASHPAYSTLYALAECIAELSGAKLGSLSLGANSAGAWLSGAVPHRTADSASSNQTSAGLNAIQMFTAPRKGYFLFGIEPEFDSVDPVVTTQSLKDAEFVVAFSSYASTVLSDVANVFLPISPYTETSGTFVNVEGRWQSFKGVVSPQEDTRPAWKILRVLGNLFELKGFDYMSSIEVRDELKKCLGDIKLSNKRAWLCPELSGNISEQIVEIPIYGADAITRRAVSLSITPDATGHTIVMN
ncbi:MAG: NADH-quinone oxidoreductase subunit G [Gammaproteobacteria bacterium]|nr:NADH-quinone oxidoreductase subunit G [Gammaproteobacteria bacterium]